MAQIHQMSDHLQEKLESNRQREKRYLLASKISLFMLIPCILRMFGPFPAWLDLPSDPSLLEWFFYMIVMASPLWLPIFGWLVFSDLAEKCKKSVGKLQAGVDGEQNMLQELKRLPVDYDVFTNLVICHRGRMSEMDAVVIGPKGIFVIENKNYSGQISGHYDESQWNRKKENGVKSTFYSPVKQVSTHVSRLAGFLRDAKRQVWVQGIVSFSDKKSELDIKGYGNIPIFGNIPLAYSWMYSCDTIVKPYGSFVSWILYYHDSKSIVITPDEQKEIVALLESSHQRFES